MFTARLRQPEAAGPVTHTGHLIQRQGTCLMIFPGRQTCRSLGRTHDVRDPCAVHKEHCARRHSSCIPRVLGDRPESRISPLPVCSFWQYQLNLELPGSILSHFALRGVRCQTPSVSLASHMQRIPMVLPQSDLARQPSGRLPPMHRFNGARAQARAGAPYRHAARHIRYPASGT
jgi:hypothetical protein